MDNDNTLSWYAARILSSKALIMQYLSSPSYEVFIPEIGGKAILGSLLFVRCTEEDILKAKAYWYQDLAVYRDPLRQKPQPIPDREMDNFRMVLSIQNQEYIPLEIKDPQFLVGQKVRVMDGPLKGAEGIVKRIKGDRRLVVSITGVAAIATSFIKPELLAPVEE